MKNMKWILAAGCCAAFLATGGILSASSAVITAGESRQEQEEQDMAPEFIGVWGSVLSVEEDRIHVDNISDNSMKGEIVITISPDDSRVVDAVNGFPVALGDLKEGDFIYAYLGPAMTMSLPPIANGKMIICKAPADFKVPEYIRVTDSVTKEDGSMEVKGSNGYTYQIPADCTILPYLTRQMVTIQELTKNRTCLIWSDESGQATKIVLFHSEDGEREQIPGPGGSVIPAE